MYDYEVTGTVELFKMKGGWFYIRIPLDISEELKDSPAVKGMIPVKVHTGNSTWNTSIMPMGDGTYFIGIKSDIRRKENISMDDEITIQFSVR